MRLVYKFNNYKHNEELFRMCRFSKDLYNQTMYIVKTNLKDGKFLFYNDLDKILKVTPNLEGEINYRKLKSQVSQQCLKLIDKNLKSYFKSIKDWSKNKNKYKGIPHLPNYLPKNGMFQLIYPNQSCSIKGGKIYFSKDLSVPIPQWEKFSSVLKNFKQIRVNPKNEYTEIEIVYETELENYDLDKSRYSSIDLGLDNLVTMVTDFSEPIIYSGKQIKSKNRYFNKTLSERKSVLEKENKKKTSKFIKHLCDKRTKETEDVYHKVSRHIVNLLTQNKIGNLIIGYNSGWKDSVVIGKVNNQNFVMISHDKLISMLEYKCRMVGINVIKHEESYTSKCDGLCLETIGRHETYLGKRKKRGLFQSSVGKLVNADVNGALNIMRKVVGDSKIVSRIINSGRLFRPLKFNNLYSLKNIEVYK